MSFISVADEAIEYFDDHTWNVFKDFGQELLEKVKKYGANSEISLAHVRVLIFMVGRAYGATRFLVRPWRYWGQGLISALKRQILSTTNKYANQGLTRLFNSAALHCNRLAEPFD